MGGARVVGATREVMVAREGHLADCKLCICAAHDEKSCNGALKREKGKGESGRGEKQKADNTTTGPLTTDYKTADHGGKAETLKAES